MRDKADEDEGQRPLSAFDRHLTETLSKGPFDTVDDEPQTLEIQYFRKDKQDGGDLYNKHQEVIFEDPEEAEKRPRLLVPLQSVLALKGLCEREFNRVQKVTKTLEACRTAYFKELLWLREQLIIATQPDKKEAWDYVMSYEVYWYDPPSYMIDPELKEFMLDCNRITNKKLIEEIYQLRMSGKTITTEGTKDDDAELKRLIKKVGAARLLKKMYALMGSKEHGSPQAKRDLEDAMYEIIGGKQDGSEADALKAEIAALREQIEGMNELRQKYKELQSELEAAKKLAASEKARADAERDRAEAERARANQLESDLSALRAGSGSEAELLRQATEKAAKRIAEASGLIAKNLETAFVPPSSAGDIEAALKSLEKLTSVKPKVKTNTVVQKIETSAPVQANPDAELQARIKELEKQLREARAALASAQEAAEQLRKKSMEPTPTKVVTVDNSEELDALKGEAELLKGENEKLKKREAELMHELENQKKKYDELKANAAKKQKALEDEIEKLAEKLTRAQEKIIFLKDELKKYKRMAGEDVNSDDDADSDYDGDIPKFLIAYFRRVKNNPKPRWQLLSENANLARKKRDWLFTNKTFTVEPRAAPSILASEANAALNFMKFQEGQAAKLLARQLQQQTGNTRGHASRSGSPQNILLGSWKLPQSDQKDSRSPSPENTLESKTEPVFAVKKGYTVSPYVKVGTREVSSSRSQSPVLLTGSASDAAALASAEAAAASATHLLFGERPVSRGEREDRPASRGRSVTPKSQSPPRSAGESPAGPARPTRMQTATAAVGAIDASAKLLASRVAAMSGDGFVPARQPNIAPDIMSTVAALAGVDADSSMERLPPQSASPALPKPLETHPLLVTGSSQPQKQAASRTTAAEVKSIAAKQPLKPPSTWSVVEKHPQSQSIGAPAAAGTAPQASASPTSPKSPRVVGGANSREASPAVSPIKPTGSPQPRVATPPLGVSSSSLSFESYASQQGRPRAKAPLVNSHDLSTSFGSTTLGSSFGVPGSSHRMPTSPSALSITSPMSASKWSGKGPVQGSVQFSPALGQEPLSQAQRNVTQVESNVESSKRALVGAKIDQIFVKSRSTPSLPFTNAPKVLSPTKLKRPIAGESTGPSGVDGHLPEALPPLAPGRIRKQPAQPYWLAGP